MVQKRGRGRPKGSRNRIQRSKSPTDPVRKLRGRPPGSGHLQRAKALAIANGEPEAMKRPVGRPSKLPPARTFAVSLGPRVSISLSVTYQYSYNLQTIHGNAGVIRSNRAADANTANPSNLHSIFTTGASSSSLHLPTAVTEPPTVPPISANIESAVEPSTVLDPDPDDESTLLRDGVGAGDDDEQSDDEERGHDDPDPANSDGPRPRRTARKLPTWLQSQFEAKVKESTARGDDGLPPLYRNQMFVLVPNPRPLLFNP